VASLDRRLEQQPLPASQHPHLEPRPHRHRPLAPNRLHQPLEQVPPLEHPLLLRLSVPRQLLRPLEPPHQLLALAAPPLAVLRPLERQQLQQLVRVLAEVGSVDLEQLLQRVRPVYSALQRPVQHHQLLVDSASLLQVQRQQVDLQALGQPQHRHLLSAASEPTSPLALGAEPSDPVS